MHLLFGFNENNKPGVCEPNKEDVMKKFTELFGIQDIDNVLVQVFHDGFKTFIDIDIYEDLADYSKLKFILKRVPEPLARPGNGTVEEVVNTNENDETEQPNVVIRERCGGTEIPHNYQLPEFDFHVQQALNTGNSVSPSISKAICKELVHHMKTNYCKDLLPSSEEYRRVVSTLLRRYPQLEDKQVVLDRKRVTKPGTGLSWRRKLKQGFARLRNINVGNAKMPHLKQLKEKFRSKTLGGVLRRKELLEQGAGSELIRGSQEAYDQHKPETRWGSGETEETTKVHKAVLAIEWAKEVPDLTITRTRMKCSKAIRWFELREMNLATIQEHYPCLSNEFQWMLELERQTGYNLKARRDESLDVGTMDKFLKSISRTRSGSQMSKALIESDKDAGKVAAIIGCMPYHCRETDVMNESWLVMNKPIMSCLPVEQVTSRPGTLNVYEKAVYIPYLDKRKLVNEQTLSLVDAFDVLVAAIVLMNVKYPFKISRSWKMLCEVIYGIPAEDDPTPYMQSLINEVSA